MRHAGSCHARLWQLVRQVRPRMLDVAPSGPSGAARVLASTRMSVQQTVISPFILMGSLPCRRSASAPSGHGTPTGQGTALPGSEKVGVTAGSCIKRVRWNTRHANDPGPDQGRRHATAAKQPRSIPEIAVA